MFNEEKVHVCVDLKASQFCSVNVNMTNHEFPHTLNFSVLWPEHCAGSCWKASHSVYLQYISWMGVKDSGDAQPALWGEKVLHHSAFYSS